MKVSEMPYQRITAPEFKEQAEKIIAKIKAAKSAEDLKAARDEYNKISEDVDTDLVPAVAKLKERIRNRLGLDKIMYYDDAISVTGEMPRPVIDTPAIFENALKMYHDMKPEIGDFMQRMLDAEAFDVEARDGKFGGGYCTTFAKYKQPFILANFNGTSGDIDVITHEFGHALAADYMFKFAEPDYPTGMETHE